MKDHTSGNSLRLVFWELTARCNLNCRHCRAEAQDESAEGELTTEDILSVAQDIRSFADPIVVLTGGEPLMRSDFFEIVGACRKRFTRLALATNGTLIDAPTAERIAACGIQRVSISLDGALASTHDAFRGRAGSFDAALRGFDALKGTGVSVQINATVTRHNVGEMNDLLDLALSRQADAFHVFLLVPVGCGAEITEDQRLSAQSTEQLLEWLFEKSVALQERLHVKVTCAPQYVRVLREVCRKTGTALPTHGHGLQASRGGCLAGSQVCFISRTGDVQPCGYLPIRVGNVREQSLAEIWQGSDVFAALRDPARLEGKCGACKYRKVCRGCRARAYAVCGNYLAEAPDCPCDPAPKTSRET